MAGISFIYNIFKLKLNMQKLPSGFGGLLLNILFLLCIGMIMYILANFWISWTFL